MTRNPHRRDVDPADALSSDVPETIGQVSLTTPTQDIAEGSNQDIKSSSRKDRDRRVSKNRDTLIQTWIGLVIVQLALIGGAVAVIGAIPSLDHWKVLLVALGASCVGFGLANLINHFSNQRQARELELDYMALKDQAELLVGKADFLLRRSRVVHGEPQSESQFFSR